MYFCGDLCRDGRYLPGRLDALDDGQTDHDPGHQQGQGHLPVQAARAVDGVADVESLTVPEVSGGRAPLALGLHDYTGGKGEEKLNGEVAMFGSIWGDVIEKGKVQILWLTSAAALGQYSNPVMCQ